MIALGASLVSQFDWVLLIFAGFLLITGVKMLVIKENHIDIENNPVLKFLRKHFRITPQLYGQKFFVALPQGTRKVMWVTPLFVALILVEFADLIFAVDSVPAIFAITKDPFIVFTSNIFAILGLRALYFALAAMVDRFVYLKVALAWVLIFIGAKVFVTDWYLKPVLGMEKFPASISLTITLALLVWGVMYSLYRTRKELKMKS
jgi:tellurite resistance protein TerC